MIDSSSTPQQIFAQLVSSRQMAKELYNSVTPEGAKPGQVWLLKPIEKFIDKITGDSIPPVFYIMDDSHAFETENAFYGFVVLPHSQDPMLERPLKPWNYWPYVDMLTECGPQVIADPLSRYVVFTHPVHVKKKFLTALLADYGRRSAEMVWHHSLRWLTSENSPALDEGHHENQFGSNVTLNDMMLAIQKEQLK